MRQQAPPSRRPHTAAATAAAAGGALPVVEDIDEDEDEVAVLLAQHNVRIGLPQDNDELVLALAEHNSRLQEPQVDDDDELLVALAQHNSKVQDTVHGMLDSQLDSKVMQQRHHKTKLGPITVWRGSDEHEVAATRPRSHHHRAANTNTAGDSTRARAHGFGAVWRESDAHEPQQPRALHPSHVREESENVPLRARKPQPPHARQQGDVHEPLRPRGGLSAAGPSTVDQHATTRHGRNVARVTHEDRENIPVLAHKPTAAAAHDHAPAPRRRTDETARTVLQDRSNARARLASRKVQSFLFVLRASVVRVLASVSIACYHFALCLLKEPLPESPPARPCIAVPSSVSFAPAPLAATIPNCSPPPPTHTGASADHDHHGQHDDGQEQVSGRGSQVAG